MNGVWQWDPPIHLKTDDKRAKGAVTKTVANLKRARKNDSFHKTQRDRQKQERSVLSIHGTARIGTSSLVTK